ncbi:MAG: hypothetical protein RL097_254 [Candidatus Parcubacteria bacterium]
MIGNALFVLGGNDGEMEVIKQLLAIKGQSWVQPKMGWGDHIYTLVDLDLKAESQMIATGGGYGYHSGHDREAQGIEGNPMIIFVECRPSDDWPVDHKPKVIDHHGERSGEPASVLQVLDLLMSEGMTRKVCGKPSSHTDERRCLARQISTTTLRWVELVAANDSGYIPAMRALGATIEEIERVRALDRSAQGITLAQEAAAETALRSAITDGRLTVVKLSHSKTAAVTDRLYGRYDQLLILSENGEVNFYGDGALCALLKVKFEGWNGGSGLGKKGEDAFWGGYPTLDKVEQFIREQL